MQIQRQQLRSSNGFLDALRVSFFAPTVALVYRCCSKDGFFRTRFFRIGFLAAYESAYSVLRLRS